MYVKVLDQRHNRSAVIYTTDPHQPLHYGCHRFDSNPSEWGPDRIMEELELGADSFDLTQLDGGLFTGTGHADGAKPYWEVSWVRFHKPGDTSVHLVAATTPVYILDESGKTIDKV